MPRLVEACSARRPPPRHRHSQAEGRLLRARAARGAPPRRMARSPASTARAGSCASAPIRARWTSPDHDPDPAHRDVDEVHDRDLARLSLHVPLLLGRLQLPAGARLLAEPRSWSARAGAGVHQQDRPRLHRGVRSPRDQRHRRRSRRPRAPGLGGLAPARRSLAGVRVQARRHRRRGPDPRARVRLRAHAADPQQAVHERGHPRPRPLDLRERHPEPEALLHGRPALRDPRRRGGHRRPSPSRSARHARGGRPADASAASILR